MKFFLLLLLCGSARGQDQWKNVYTETAWAERDQWQKPEEIIRKLAIQKGSKVADIGCHEGYLSFKLSTAVGPTGEVFAVDLDPIRLEKLKAHAEKENIRNIFTIKGVPDDPLLPSTRLDAVVILDTYHEMKEHQQVLRHIRAALKPGGRLVICEPIADARRSYSREGQEGKHELGMNFAMEDLRLAGFQILFKKDPYLSREKIKGDNLWIIVAVNK